MLRGIVKFQITGLAELHSAQPFTERVLREGAEGRQEAREGELLELGPRQLQHVRQWLIPQEAETLQEEGCFEERSGRQFNT